MLNSLKGATPHLLASVKNVEEAARARMAGAAILDCKDPSRGALGALDLDEVRLIVADAAGRLPVSATIGDLPARADLTIAAAECVAAAGVQIVKCGFFGTPDDRTVAEALGKADLGQAGLFAVLMADRAGDFSILPDLARAGFLGVMLDTADKASGSLLRVLKFDRIKEFLVSAKANGLAAGLAGSLGAEHVSVLVPLGPDILGFRGAICNDGRQSTLVASRVAGISAMIERARAAQSAQAAG